MAENEEVMVESATAENTSAKSEAPKSKRPSGAAKRPDKRDRAPKKEASEFALYLEKNPGELPPLYFVF